MSKIVRTFPKKIFIEKYQLGHQHLIKSFFDKFNFENNGFLKSYPIFDGLSIIDGIYYFFSYNYVDSWPKILFFRINLMTFSNFDFGQG